MALKHHGRLPDGVVARFVIKNADVDQVRGIAEGRPGRLTIVSSASETVSRVDCRDLEIAAMVKMFATDPDEVRTSPS